MKGNAHATMEPSYDIDPIFCLWCTTFGLKVLTHMFLEYLKLTKIALVHVIRSVEDECVFSSIAFLKSKLRNSLDPHLPMVVGMYSHKYLSWRVFHKMQCLIHVLQLQMSMATMSWVLSGYSFCHGQSMRPFKCEEEQPQLANFLKVVVEPLRGANTFCFHHFSNVNKFITIRDDICLYGGVD